MHALDYNNRDARAGSHHDSHHVAVRCSAPGTLNPMFQSASKLPALPAADKDLSVDKEHTVALEPETRKATLMTLIGSSRLPNSAQWAVLQVPTLPAFKLPGCCCLPMVASL